MCVCVRERESETETERDGEEEEEEETFNEQHTTQPTNYSQVNQNVTIN